MELSPSWEVASCAAAEQFTNVLWNPKAHHHAHKTPPLAPILTQISPVHTIPSYFPKIHLNIISLRLGLPNGLFAFGISCVHSCPPLCFLHAFSFSSSLTWPFWLYLAKNTSYEAPRYASYHYIPLRSKCTPQHPVLKYRQSMFFP
jgi:hypothetical protein